MDDNKIKMEQNSLNIPYNIQIIHNIYNQPMININKGNQQILRQEINRWEYINCNKWRKD